MKSFKFWEMVQSSKYTDRPLIGLVKAVNSRDIKL